MTRKEAIKIIQYARNALDDKSETAKAYDMALNSLKVDEMYDLEMENAEAFVPLSVIYDNENRWIPVSERLPEYTDYYLVTVPMNEYGTGMFTEIRTATYNCRDKQFQIHTNRDGLTIIGDVIAWQELPEPYKAD